MAGKKNTTGFKNEIPSERLDKDNKYILDETEKERILHLWNVDKILNLKDLILGVWNNSELDGRSKQGMALRSFLATRNFSATPAQLYIKKTETEQLLEEDKEFIKNHAIEFNPLQISKMRWPDMIGIGDLRYRLCREYYESLPPEFWSPKYQPLNKEYFPPKSPIQALARLRDYKICDWDEDTMSVFQKTCIKKLIEFANIHRFSADMSCIKNQKERDLVECEFLRHIYDKPDLSSEDISIYLNTVFMLLDVKRLREDEERSREMIENSVDDEGKYRFNQPMVDYLGKIKDQIGDRLAKIEKSFNLLNGERAKRLANKGTETASLAEFVSVLKDKVKRDKVLKLLKKEEEKLHAEMAELQSMEALKFEMWGANPDELY